MIETHRFPALLAAASLVILLHQMADLATLLPVADLATPAGRVGQLFAAQARTPALLVGDLILIWALLARRSPGALRVVAGLHLTGGTLLLLLAPWFLIDAGRLAGGSGTDTVAFQIVAGRTLLLLLLIGIGALLAGRVLFSAAREVRSDQS
jgi:hypothetical protein